MSQATMPPPVAKPKFLTAEEFAILPDPPDGSKQELVKGVIITMPPPKPKHGNTQLNVGTALKLYQRRHRQGKAFVESGVITARDPDSVRGPDVSFWMNDRMPVVPDDYPSVAADLCVEVLSPGNRPKALAEKLQEYFAAGVRMVWIVDPKARTVVVYRTMDDARLYHDYATLTCEDVLPGFSCPVAEFFE